MRSNWLCVGIWCGSTQLGLVYGLSFLWSATPVTAVWILLSWLGGSLIGLHQRRSHSSLQWLGPCLPALLLGYVPLPPQVLLISSLTGGWAAGAWLLKQEEHLVRALRWESLGMGVGYLLTGLTAYRGLNSVIVWQLLCTGALLWRDRHWLDGGFARSR